MIPTILIMMAVSIPHGPVHIRKTSTHSTQVEWARSPNWGRDPVTAAKFMTHSHQSRADQLAALEYGRKVTADYNQAQRLTKMPVVGQIQQSFSTSVTRGFNTTIPGDLGTPSAPVPLTPQNIGSRR